MPYPPKFPLLEPMLHTRGKEGFKVGYRLLYRRLLTLYLLDALGKEVLEGERGKRNIKQFEVFDINMSNGTTHIYIFYLMLYPLRH